MGADPIYSYDLTINNCDSTGFNHDHFPV